MSALDDLEPTAVELLQRHLYYMASLVAPETSAIELEAAIEEALSVVRPKRIWR